MQAFSKADIDVNFYLNHSESGCFGQLAHPLKDWTASHRTLRHPFVHRTAILAFRLFHHWSTRARMTMATIRSLDRLLDQLPSELVVQILHCAASEFVHVDRHWVVQLALVSRFVYDLVHPVLYRNMVVTDTNKSTLEALALEDSSSHVFQAVRRLVADKLLNTWDDDLLRRLSGVTSIDASLALIHTLSQSPEFHPRSLAVRYSWLATFTRDLPSATLSSVTHLIGYFPSGYQPMRITSDCIENILAAMPALTHIGFDVLDLSRFFDEDESDDSAEPLDLEDLEQTLRTVLQHSRIEAVAMRVAGDWLRHWPAVSALSIKLRDVRVLAWHDTRKLRSWRTEAECAASDAWAGKDMWTEAVQVWSPSA